MAIKTIVNSCGKIYAENPAGYEIGEVVKLNIDENNKIIAVDTKYKDVSREGNETLKKDIEKTSLVWSPDAYSFCGAAILNQSTVIFKVPSKPSGSSDDYSVLTPSSIPYSTYTAEVYDIKRSGIAGAAVFYINQIYETKSAKD